MSGRKVLIFALTSAIIMPWVFSCGGDNSGSPIENQKIFGEAMENFREGEYDLALGGFQEAAARAPDDIKPVLGMTWCYLMKGEDEKAKAMMDKAVRLDPDDPELNAMLCWRYLGEGKYKSALACAQKTLSSSTFTSAFQPSLDDESIKAAMAFAYFQMRDYTSAAEVLGVEGEGDMRALKEKLISEIEDALR